MDTLNNFNMDTLNNFTRTAQDIHNKHFEQKLNKDQEIAERRINEYLDKKLNLSWNTIIREINKLNELTRNKYFELLVEEQKEIVREQFRKEIFKFQMESYKILKLKNKLIYLFLSAFLVQTLIVILTH